MVLQTPLTDMLKIRYPIIQAPMAGGITTPALVAAVAEAGGLGSIGAGYLAPAVLRETIQQVQAQTRHAFAVNLFVPEPVPAPLPDLAAAQALLQPFRDELDLAIPELPTSFAPVFAEQVAVVLEAGVPIIGFTFGIPDAATVQRCKAAGAVLIGTATSLPEAQALQAAGMDVIVAQGSEAGGHRGTFLGAPEQAMIGSMALIPQLVDALAVPVVAAGGIMDGRGVLAALVLGAAGVQLGTAFLATSESGANTAYKQAVLAATHDTTTITRAFSGKAARGIHNQFIATMATHEADLPPYPIQNTLTRDIRQAAARQGNAALLSLWAGQGVAQAQAGTAAALIERLVAEVAQLQAGLADAD